MLAVLVPGAQSPAQTPQRWPRRQAHIARSVPSTREGCGCGKAEPPQYGGWRVVAQRNDAAIGGREGRGKGKERVASSGSGGGRFADPSCRRQSSISLHVSGELNLLPRTGRTHLDWSPRIRLRINPTSLNKAPDTTKTRREVRKAASLCRFFERTIASNLDGGGSLLWIAGARRVARS